MMSFRQFIEQGTSSTTPPTHSNLDQLRRILGVSKDLWKKTSVSGSGVYILGNYLFPNGLWFATVSVQVLSEPQNVKTKTKDGKPIEKPYVKVRVLASKASNPEMIYRYKKGKPIEVNEKIGDFEAFIPYEDLMGFGFGQNPQNMGAGGPPLI